MEKVKEYYKQAKVELDKVIFPTKDQTKTAYISVVVVVVVTNLRWQRDGGKACDRSAKAR